MAGSGPVRSLILTMVSELKRLPLMRYAIAISRAYKIGEILAARVDLDLITVVAWVRR